MSSADIDGMGIKALKELIASAGLSTEDCLDKADLRQRAREAVAKGPKVAASTASPAGGGERTLGGYPCIVKGPPELLEGGGGGEKADLLIIALHGLGASSSDLADVPTLLGQLEPSLSKSSGCRMVEVYPQAPQGAMGAAWWSLDFMAFMQAQMAPPGPQREALTAQFIRKKPDGMDECRAQMLALLAEARTIAGGADGPLPLRRVLLAGFSLGAITALDLALLAGEGEKGGGEEEEKEQQRVGGVIFMNGAPICVDEWAERMKHNKKLRVHLTGGRADTTLPCECVGWVDQLLTSQGIPHTLDLHPGGHEVGGPAVLRGIAGFAKEVLEAGRA
jgi:predicted esterase